MVRVVADASVPYVIAHWQNHSHNIQDHDRYADVARDVSADLQRRAGAIWTPVSLATSSSVTRYRICQDGRTEL